MRREVAPKKEDWGSVSQRLAALEGLNLSGATREEQRELWESSMTRRVSELETYAEGMLPVMQRLQCCEDYIGLSGTHTPFNASKSTDIFTRITRLENPFELLATREWVKKEARVGHHFRIIAFTALVGVLSLGWEVFVRLPHRMDHLEFNTKTAIEMSSKPAVGATTANQFVVSAGTLPAEIHPTEGTQIEVTWLKPCWGSYTDQIGKVTQVGNVEGGYVGNYFVFGPITIRSVCPGYVRYRVNGELVSPPNLSRTPEKSEVVTLPEVK